VGTRFARSVFAAESTLFSTHPIIINDATNDERIDPSFAAQLKRQKTYSLATVPLAVGISQVGTLVLEAEQVHKFTEREIQPYLSLAPQVAVAVENRRLLTETQAALAEVEATQRRYTVQAWENYVTQHRALTYEQTREGLAPLGDQLPVETRQAVTLKQTSFTGLHAPNGHEAADTDDQPHPNGSGSSLVVPLTLRGEVIGVLGLQETDGTRQWSPEEIALVEEICEQLTQAAEGIRLLDESQQRAAREARVNEIGEKIQAAQSLEEALQIAVREVGRSLRAPQTRVELEVK
jgi:GAF domain-containing protein